MIPATIAVLLIIFLITETAKHEQIDAPKPKLALSYFDWRFKFFVAIATLFAIGNSSDVFLILRAEQVGVPATMIPILYLVFTLVYSLSAMPAGIAADRFGKKRLVLLGFLLFAAVYFGFAALASSMSVWFLFAFYGLFMGITEGVQKAFLATIIPAEFKATAFGVYNMCIGFALLPASFIAGRLWDKVSPSAPFYFGGMTALSAASLFLLLASMMRKNQS